MAKAYHARSSNSRSRGRIQVVYPETSKAQDRHCPNSAHMSTSLQIIEFSSTVAEEAATGHLTEAGGSLAALRLAGAAHQRPALCRRLAGRRLRCASPRWRCSASPRVRVARRRLALSQPFASCFGGVSPPSRRRRASRLRVARPPGNAGQREAPPPGAPPWVEKIAGGEVKRRRRASLRPAAHGKSPAGPGPGEALSLGGARCCHRARGRAVEGEVPPACSAAGRAPAAGLPGRASPRRLPERAVRVEAVQVVRLARPLAGASRAAAVRVEEAPSGRMRCPCSKSRRRWRSAAGYDSPRSPDAC